MNRAHGQSDKLAIALQEKGGSQAQRQDFNDSGQSLMIPEGDSDLYHDGAAPPMAHWHFPHPAECSSNRGIGADERQVKPQHSGQWLGENRTNRALTPILPGAVAGPAQSRQQFPAAGLNRPHAILRVRVFS